MNTRTRKTLFFFGVIAIIAGVYFSYYYYPKHVLTRQGILSDLGIESKCNFHTSTSFGDITGPAKFYCILDERRTEEEQIKEMGGCKENRTWELILRTGLGSVLRFMVKTILAWQ